MKKTPAPVTWAVDASVSGGKLTATATTKVKMSTFGIGPISIAGLVSTSDDVTLTMKLTALDPSKFTIATIDRRARVGAAAEGQPVVRERDHAGAAGELRVVPQPRPGRRRALVARHRRPTRPRSPTASVRSSAPDTCRRGRRRRTVSRS